MAEDWAADVKKYVANADDAIISGIVRYCGIALQKRDSSMVSFSDPKETDRVRNNFLKKKLALTHSDAELDEAIAEVGERMKADRTKNRVTVYYLLAERFGCLGLFAKNGSAAAKAPSTSGELGAGAAGAGAAALGLAGLGATTDAPPAAPAARPDPIPARTSIEPDPVEVAPATLAGAGLAGAGLAGAGLAAVSGAANDTANAASKAGYAPAGAVGGAVVGAASMASSTRDYVAAAAPTPLLGNRDDDGSAGGSLSWLWWLLLALLVLALLWWLFFRPAPAPVDVAAPAATKTSAAATAPVAGSAAATDAVDMAKAPAEGSVAIPAGAGVTSEVRDGNPVVKVYFNSGKADVAPAIAPAAAGLKTWLDGHQGRTLAVSGYNDATGNAAANAELSKNRAQAVQAALISAGIPEASVALVKPENATDTNVPKEGARRVEIVVK